MSESRLISKFKKCKTCQSIVEQNNYDSHVSNDCPPSNSLTDCAFAHIREKKLFTFLKILDPIGAERFQEFQDDIIEISLSVIQLCDIAIGEPVVIVARSGQCIVKKAWPIVEQDVLSSVTLTKQSAYELNDPEGGVEIRKMKCSPLLARTILVEWLEMEMFSESHIAEIKSLLTTRFDKKIVARGQNLVFPFYGRAVKFKVLGCQPYRAGSDKVDILNDSFSKIQLEDDDSSHKTLYKMFAETIWEFENMKRTTPGNANRQKRRANLGAMDNFITELENIVSRTLTEETAKERKLSCGVLIHGVSGTGKTTLAKYVIESTRQPVIEICSSGIFSRYYGEAETRMKALFEEAIEKAPCLVLIDGLDTFCPGQAASDQERRVLALLLSMLDKLNDHRVVVIGIVKQLDAVDVVFRRPGRFDFEIEIPVPDASSRVEILKKLLLDYKHNITDELIEQLGRTASHGLVGADLSLVCTLANTKAADKFKKRKMKDFVIDEDDFRWAFTQVKPSAMREIQVQIPNVKWSDIGGQEDLKLKLQQVVEWPLKHPESFARLSLTPPRGVLLFGPPGCSKTMIAKAVATESKLNFISIKGAELFSKWVGESEKAVREVFRKARTVSPCVVFFDEIDAISAERDSDSGGGSQVQERVLSQLLTEMDGFEQLGYVTIIAATNRPDRIDSALLRPGRLDRKLYVSLPEANTRRAIFALQFTKTPIDEDVDTELLVSRTEGYSGAEVVSVCHEAAMRALQNDISAERVSFEHFEYALNTVKPRTSKKLLKVYEKFLASGDGEAS